MRGLLVCTLASACVQGGGDTIQPGADAPVTLVDAGAPDHVQLPDATPPTGSVGYTGGSVDRLVFAVFGDVRPASLDSAQDYPTQIIDTIMGQIGNSYAEFAIGTGDYMFADTKSQVDTQLASLVAAEKHLGTRPIFHAMGNHECDTATAGNCPNGTETANMIAFMGTLVPFATHPYFAFNVMTRMGEAKIVVLAANAWSTAQATWLESTLAQPTKYTIVVRHEPPSDTRAPGVTPSETILARHTVTLLLYGHTHTYARYGVNGVISGNAGAPASGYYGWLNVEQQPDGNLAVMSIDKDNGEVIDRWVVDPAGHSVP